MVIHSHDTTLALIQWDKGVFAFNPSTRWMMCFKEWVTDAKILAYMELHKQYGSVATMQYTESFDYTVLAPYVLFEERIPVEMVVTSHLGERVQTGEFKEHTRQYFINGLEILKSTPVDSLPAKPLILTCGKWVGYTDERFKSQDTIIVSRDDYSEALWCVVGLKHSQYAKMPFHRSYWR